MFPDAQFQWALPNFVRREVISYYIITVFDSIKYFYEKSPHNAIGCLATSNTSSFVSDLFCKHFKNTLLKPGFLSLGEEHLKQLSIEEALYKNVTIRLLSHDQTAT